MHSHEPRRRLKVLLADGRPNNDSITSDVRPETTQGDRPARGIENSGPNLYRSKHGFEFYQGQSRYDPLRIPLIQDPFNII